MKRTSRQTFDAFCREAIDFLTPRRRLDDVLLKAALKPTPERR